MHEATHQQRAETMPPKDCEGTLPPDATLTSVNVTIAELVAREVAWLAEHAE
jgi:hypothetical protein